MNSPNISFDMSTELLSHFVMCPECQRQQAIDPTNDFCPEAYRIIKISKVFEETSVSVQ